MDKIPSIIPEGETTGRKEITSFNVHPEGESIALTARGRVFIVPAGEGRVSGWAGAG